MSHETYLTGYSPPASTGEECLVVIHAPARRLLGVRLALAKRELVLGRDPNCDLVLDVRDVSRRHARVREERGVRLVEDLDSRNGTFVGEERVDERALSLGDRLRLGSVVLKYMVRDDLEALCHAEMKRLADEDALTGLAHRGVLDEALEREVARSLRHGHPLSLALLDLDRFKVVNDTYGHLAGDLVLRELARSMKPLVRAEQLLARYGGDELALLLPDVPLEKAAVFIDKIRRLVEERTFDYEGARIRVTLSIGLTSLQPGDRKADALLGRADALLYEAKAERNRICS